MVLKGWRSLTAITVALAPLASADICSKLKTENIQVNQQLNVDYTSELQKYWSTACGALKPSCIVFPSSAQEVSTAIDELHHVDDLFAVKSGGHMPNNGFASIQDGVLIATKNLNQVVYHPEDQTADIGPGLSWEEAQKGLDETGRTIVGGRMGGVGVGGYILGGGLSFLSSQYGWAANNVLDFEVVLANGTIVHANEKENTDLFGALKGGGNNFGIVTSFRLQTHPQDHKVWGGNYIFTPNKTADLLDAVYEFTTNYPDDKAAIIMTADHGALVDTWIMFLFYDAPSPPDHVFKKFRDIEHIDTTKTWDSYYDLLKNNDIFILQGQRYIIGTETTPLPKNGSPAILQTSYDHWHEVTNSILEVPGLLGSMALQPMPGAITRKAKQLGGDLYDFDPDHDYIIFELDFSHLSAGSDEKVDAALQNLYKGLDKRITDSVENGTLPDAHRPLFMNDAYFREDFWGRIRDDKREEALEARKKYDPDLFWQKRTSGGFRLG